MIHVYLFEKLPGEDAYEKDVCAGTQGWRCCGDAPQNLAAAVDRMLSVSLLHRARWKGKDLLNEKNIHIY